MFDNAQIISCYSGKTVFAYTAVLYYKGKATNTYKYNNNRYFI